MSVANEPLSLSTERPELAHVHRLGLGHLERCRQLPLCVLCLQQGGEHRLVEAHAAAGERERKRQGTSYSAGYRQADGSCSSAESQLQFRIRRRR